MQGQSEDAVLTNFKGSFDDIIKIFIPNASGYKTPRKNRREKGTAKKICFKYPRLLSWAVVQEIPFASNSSFTEEEACAGNLHIKVALHCGESKTL